MATHSSSCLENALERGAWQAIVCGVAKSQTRLSDTHHKQRLLFTCSVMSNSLWTHGLQHTRLPCPSLYPRVCSNSCPSSRWCHPTISSSAVPFSSCLQSFPASRSFPMSQFFPSSGQIWELQLQHPSFQWIFRISFRADWFDLLVVQGTLKSLLQHNDLEASVLQHWALFMVQLLHLYMTTRKQTLLGQKLLVLSLVWSVMLRSGWWLDLWMTAVKILRDTF